MADNHIIAAGYAAGGYTKTRPAFQYDYGQELQLQGFPEGMLPASFEMHFSIGMGQAITRIGTDGAVAVPNACLERFGTLTAWLFLHDAETDGETKYVIEIPVRSRAKTTDQEPTPAEQSVITEAIAALNAGVTAAEAAQAAAEAAAESVGEAAEQAQGKAGEAAASATAAAGSAEAAAGSATSAAGAATFAGESASAAAGSATAASGSAEAAAGSATAAAGSAAAAAQTVAGIEEAGAAQVLAVNTAGAAKVDAINTAGTEKVNAINTAGTEKVNAVNTAGAAQVQAVEAKGEEVIEEIPADYSELSADVTNLKSAIVSYNSAELFGVFADKGTKTNGGLTYTWNSATDTYAVSGTTTGVSYKNLWSEADGMPPFVVPGETYRVKYTTTDSKVRLHFAIVTPAGKTNTYFDSDGTITIPDTATAMTIRFVVTSIYTGSTINCTISEYKMVSGKTNAELANEITGIVSDYLPVKYSRYSPITSTTDYDNLTTPGVYQIASSSSAPGPEYHCPIQAAHILIVSHTYASDRHLQIVASTSGIFWRMHTNRWYDWERLANDTSIESLKDHIDVYDFSCDAKQDTQTSGNVTYTYLGGSVWSVVTSGSSPSSYYNLFNESTFSRFHAGQKLFIDFESDSGATYVQTFKYVNGQTSLLDSPANGWITIPSDATGFGIRFRTNAQMSGNVEFHLLADSSVLSMVTELQGKIEAMENLKSNINILKSSSETYNYLIRCEYDDQNDIVYSIGIPSKKYNYVISMNDMRLIPKDTPLASTESEYTGADVYKPLDDEIPAMRINDVFVGSNHGNPNYTRVYCQHSLDETAIGTVWTDGSSNSYTLVNVASSYLIFGSLDSNDKLVVRQPQTLTNGSTTLAVTSSSEYQLRRSAINKKYTIRNDAGNDVSNGGGGNNIIVTEEYDINDQSAGLEYLQDNVGNCTNKSYYDDGQIPVLGHIINTFQFNRNGSITCFGSLIAKESIVNNKIFGAMSLNFSSYDTGYSDNLYVPNSGNCKEIRSYTGSSDQLNVTLDSSSEIMHHRYYQIAGNGFAHFLHMLDMGCYDNAARKLIEKPAYNSSTANKFYLNLTDEVNMINGDVLSWGYGRGPYKYTADRTVLCWFDYNQGYIVSMDWHNGHSGLVKLPYYMAGKSVEILEKTDSVTVSDTVATNVGVQVSCNGYGYVVMYLH